MGLCHALLALLPGMLMWMPFSINHHHMMNIADTRKLIFGDLRCNKPLSAQHKPHWYFHYKSHFQAPKRSQGDQRVLIARHCIEWPDNLAAGWSHPKPQCVSRKYCFNLCCAIATTSEGYLGKRDPPKLLSDGIKRYQRHVDNDDNIAIFQFRWAHNKIKCACSSL